MLGPLALGGTHPIAIVLLDAVMTVAIVLWAYFFRPTCTRLLIPLMCMALPGLQLLPLPDRLLVVLAPVSAGAWKLVHAGMPNAWGRVSIDPAETVAAARHLFLSVGTVLAVADLAAWRPSRNWLMAALAASGIVISILGVAFPVRPNTFLLLGFIEFQGPLMPGRTPLLAPVATAGFGFPEAVQLADQCYFADSWIVGDGFGPYLVTNHFAGAMSLTIPFVVAGWLQVSRRHLGLVPRLAVGAGVIGATAGMLVCLAKSRAGTASFGMAALVFACLSLPSGWWRRAAVVVAGTYAAMIACLLAILFGPFENVDRVFPAVVQPRIAAILADGRVLATRVAERMFLASPVLGTGLGTYGDLYPTMTRDGIPLYFAHNEYTQLLAEAGIVGLVGLCCAAGILGMAAVSFWRSAGGTDRLVGAAAWAAVAGLAVHSCFDWNLRIPANSYLFCLAAGLALASPLPAAGLAGSDRSTTAVARGIAFLVMAAAGVAIGMSFRDAVSEIVQRDLRESIVLARRHAADPKAQSPGEPLRQAITAGERMAYWDPADAQLAVSLGQAYLHRAMLPLPIDDANACLASALAWFRQAKLNCPVCRGVAAPPDLGAADKPSL